MRSKPLGNIEDKPVINKVKCAIYVRVSSDIQDYERQIVDLKQFSKDNKFSIPKDGVFEDKLSGYKDEYERAGIRSLMDYCLKNSIKKVLIWELSRLARKHLVLLRLVEFFKINNINIYFKKQGLWLLNETGEIDDPVGMMISVMGWYGEYESKLMKERFISQKKLNESLGKYNGGKITFGYKLDENNKYIVNEKKIDGLDISEADIVKEVFDLYEQGLTCSKICRICRSKGYPKIVCNNHTLARLLRNTSYLGFKEVKLGKRPTPSIINPSQFYTIGKLIDSNKTKADKGKKHIYLLRGVLKCAFCEDYYVGKQTDDSYICPKNSGSNKANKNSFCKGGNISVSNIDGIIWERVKNRLLSQKSDGFDNIIEGGEINLHELKDQIIRYKDLIIKTDQKRKKTNIIFQNDGYSIDEYQKAIKDINNEKIECEKAIESMESTISYYEKLKIESNKLSKRIENINSIEDRLQMKTIIKSLIKSVIIHKVSYYKTIVSIHYYGGHNEILLYNSVAKKGNIYKLIDSKYIRFDLNDRVFYFLNESQNIIFRARTEIINKERIGINLPEYIPLQDFARLIRTYNLTNIKESDFLDPYPDRTNSLMFDFEGLMNHEDVPDILNTHYYTKLTYFKDLNKSRFSRKKNFKKY